MKIRVEFEDIKQVDKLLETLEKDYEIISVSKEHPNRPPSKSFRIYIEVEEDV